MTYCYKLNIFLLKTYFKEGFLFFKLDLETLKIRWLPINSYYKLLNDLDLRIRWYDTVEFVLETSSLIIADIDFFLMFKVADDPEEPLKLILKFEETEETDSKN